MRNKPAAFTLYVPIIAMTVLILDSETAFSGTLEGLELCIRTVIPSLFPFFVLSVLLTSALIEHPIRWLTPLGNLCGIPSGAEGIFLLGLIGGYPVGAQAIKQAWEAGALSENDAKRMLGFCNNCGPSFLFGITATVFSDSCISWILWGIHLLSAVLTGFLLPKHARHRIESNISESQMDLPKALWKGAKNLATVCGWIILARCITAYLEKWMINRAPETLQIIVYGFLELTNGCIASIQIESEWIRFLAVSAFLAAGGVCVALQTVSVTGNLGTGWYFPGKLLQLSNSLFLGATVSPFLYPESRFHPIFLCLPVISAGIICYIRKKEVAFSGKLMYNHCQITDAKEPTPCFSAVKSPNPAPTVPTEPKSLKDRSSASKKVS